MIITTRTKYKIDIDKIERESVNSAFGADRLTVNEDGLSDKALEDKKTVIAYREMARLFVRAVYDDLAALDHPIVPDDRRMVERIAVEAIKRGADGAVYLRQFCK